MEIAAACHKAMPMTDAFDPQEHAAASEVRAGASEGCARVVGLADSPPQRPVPLRPGRSYLR